MLEENNKKGGGDIMMHGLSILVVIGAWLESQKFTVYTQ